MFSRTALVTLGACLTTIASPLVQAQQKFPVTWVDKDTGHRIYRLTDEAGSSGFYFNNNAYSPDGRFMVYTAPDGIHTMELATKKTRLLVPNPPRAPGETPSFRSGVHAIVVGKKTNSVFYSMFDSTANASTIYKADLDTGAVTKLATLPPRAGISTVNADETLGAGSFAETDEAAARDPSRSNTHTTTDSTGRPVPTPLVQAADKSQMMEKRLAAHIPVVLFTVDLNTGKMKVLLHSTDWIGHLLFSPADPTLLMYCHEGPWHKVDRIWTIRTDGSQNQLMHKRTMLMEIAGHEFWGLDGETIWYDWQTPKGEDFWLASYNLKTFRRVAYHMQRDEWSIHFNLTGDLSLFAGDGGDSGQVAHSRDGTWIELFRPEMRRDEDGLDAPDFVRPGVFHSEHLVNMAHHNYRLEPNVRISPDKSMVFFTSNMFGPSYVFGVEVAKAVNPKPEEVISTPELGGRYTPSPTPTPDDK
jgi:oligogalacturonide lyase